MTIGSKVAIRDINGIWASPDAPNATNVKNGPSFKDNKAYAPTSVSSPYWDASDAYNPPLQFVNAERTANGDKPNTPAGPKIFPTSIPILAPTTNFPIINKDPFFNALGANLKLIWDPIKNIKQARIVDDAFVSNNAVVNPPIFKTCGQNVLTNTPIKRGTIIMPPGILSSVFLIGICIIIPPKIFSLFKTFTPL